MKTCLLVVTVVVAACSENQPPLVNTQVQAPACATQAAELKTFIAAVLDPAQKVAPPFPTGDAGFDAVLDKWRADLREDMRPADPSEKALVLGPMPKRGRIDDELAPCAQATQQLKAIGEADDKQAAWLGLADAIGACDCKTNIAILKAWLYVFHRGPD